MWNCTDSIAVYVIYSPVQNDVCINPTCNSNIKPMSRKEEGGGGEKRKRGKKKSSSSRYIRKKEKG